MKKVTKAAIYARISSDQTGEGLGVQRQLKDCRKLAAERGWTVAEEYVDNDTSAFRGKARPAYERMLADIESGSRDAVIAYHQDRLTRRPIEWEQFVELCDRAGVEQLVTVTSDIAFGNDNGMLIARITAAVAANESDRKSARIRRKIAENVELGLPNGGAQRPFGFEDDRMTVREAEAQIVRSLAERFLAGESVRSLAAWMNASDVPTTAGGTDWRTTTVRGILRSGRIAGLREHRGQVVGAAAWPAIISPEQRERILLTFASRQASGRRAPRRYLLSGLLKCGKCGHTLFSSSREDRRRYVCLSGPDHGGCGRLTVVAPPVEGLIADAVLLRLDTPQMADTLTGREQHDDKYQILVDESRAVEDKMNELTDMWTEGEISRADWSRARKTLEARLEAARRQIALLRGTDTLSGLVGRGSELAAAWDTLNLDRQAAIVRAVLDYATINAGTPGARTLDPSRVAPVWKL
nr:recombinase family protein [Labedella phragmitis]